MKLYAVLDVPGRRMVTRDLTESARIGVRQKSMNAAGVELQVTADGHWYVLEFDRIGNAMTVAYGRIEED